MQQILLIFLTPKSRNNKKMQKVMCGLFIDKTTKSSLVHGITMFLQSFACHCGCIHSLFLRINASATSLQNNRDGPNAKPKIENQNVWLLQLFRKDLYLFILKVSISTLMNCRQKEPCGSDTSFGTSSLRGTRTSFS